MRFCGRQACSLFLRSYREGALRAALQKCLAAALGLRAVTLQLELRAGAQLLDPLLTEEERCLSCILAEKVRPRKARAGAERGPPRLRLAPT